MTDIVTVRCRMYKLLSNPSVRAATSYKISYRGSRALKVTMMTYKSDGKQIDVCLAAKKEEKVDGEGAIISHLWQLFRDQ